MTGNGAAWRANAVCRAAGVTYRQLDYWDRAGHVSPSIAGGAGSGTRRLYSTDDVVVVAILADLLTVGVPPRRAVDVAHEAKAYSGAFDVAFSRFISLTVDVAAARAVVAEHLNEYAQAELRKIGLG